MRLRFVGCLVVLSLIVPVPQRAQQTVATSPVAVVRDAQAVALLQNSLTAMGTTLPTDSTANGSVTVVAGSLTSHGTVQILTRGTNQTSIQFQTDSSNWSVIYSKGDANRVDSSGTKYLHLSSPPQTNVFISPCPIYRDCSEILISQSSMSARKQSALLKRITFAFEIPSTRQSKIIDEYDNGAAVGSATREYYYSGSTLVAKLESGLGNYYQHDHLSNRLVTDNSGTVVEQCGRWRLRRMRTNG